VALVLMPELTPAATADPAAPRLLPASAGNGVAALLVPEGLCRHITCNGVPLPPGAHVLQHTDRVEYGGQVWWVAATSEVREIPYDAATHGEDMYCYITKVRLRPGESIIACPGRPGTGCAALYRKAAWDMALAANARFRCPRCGFEPAAAQWRPELPRTSRLPQLLALAHRHRAEDTT
jgi:hypothetical protein